MAAPGKDGDSFVLDMATSSVALGKVNKEFIEPRISNLSCHGVNLCIHPYVFANIETIISL